MPLLVKVRSFLRNLFSFRRVEGDLDQEVHSHLEMLTEENIRSGMQPKDARRAARIELGGIEQVKEQVREETPWQLAPLRDLRLPLRWSDNSARIPASPPSPCLPSPSASARPRQFSALYTACCCGPLAVPPIRTGSWPSLRSPRRAGRRTLRIRTRRFSRPKAAASRRLAKYNDNVASVSGASQPTRTTVAGVSPDFLKVFGIQRSRSLGGISTPATRKKGPAPPFLSAMDTGSSSSDRREISRSRT